MKPEKKAAATEQFSISALMERYVQKQSQAHRDGLALPDLSGDVLPYDAGPIQVVEPRVAWNDALFALTLEGDAKTADMRPCPEWGGLVGAQDPALSVAFCVGNFPQMVRNFLPVLQGNELTAQPLTMSRPVAGATYLKWAETAAASDWPAPLIAVGVLRLAGELNKASETLASGKNDVPKQLQGRWHNERAALSWHAGDHEDALKQWQSQEPTTLVRFNRGMASLFLGKHAQAHAELTQAAAGIPDTGAWHHLAQLYLTLAAMRA